MASPTEEVDFGGVGDPLNPSDAAMRLSDFSSPQQLHQNAAGRVEPGVAGGGLGGSELPFAQPPAPAPAPMGSAAPVQLIPAPMTNAPASSPSPAVTAAASMGASVSSAAGSLFERIRAAQAQAQTGGSPSRAAPLMSGSEQPADLGGGEEGGGSSTLGASSQFFSAISGRSSSLLSGSSANGGYDGNNATAGAAANDPSAGYDTGTFYAPRADMEPSHQQQLQQQQPVDAAGAPPTVPGSGGLRVPSYTPVPNAETAHAPYNTGDSTSDRAKMALSSAWGTASKLGSKAARAGSRAAGSIMDKARGDDGNNLSLLSEGNGMHGGNGGGAELMESGTNLGGSGASFGAQFSGATSSSNAGGAMAAGAPEGASAAMSGIGSHSGYGPVSGQEGGGGQGQEEYNMWAYFRTFVGDLCGLVERAPLWVQSVLLLLFVYFLWSVLK
mmetsp:Transcript_4168/g.11482  ORF Transcript_4168/g.11482 Transcript_4168/m.11482 type:complete len:442 (-) Transcript_4168:357-1682(-)